MITDDVQRWNRRQEYRRRADEMIRTSEYEVAPISPTLAKAFVREHHYSGTCSSPAHAFGLAHHGELVGVSCFGPPASTNAHNKVFPTLTQKEAVTLGRLVLQDSVAGNGETWFIARCFELLATPKLYRPIDRKTGQPRVPVVAVESCADPQPRANDRGDVVFRGHLGTIYQALNGQFIGMTNHATLRLFNDGTVFSNVASGKVVRADQGEDYAIGQLVSHGADALQRGEDPLTWIRTWKERLTHKMRHRGNYRYLWSLDRRRRKEVLSRFPTLPYPKNAGWKSGSTSTLETTP